MFCLMNKKRLKKSLLVTEESYFRTKRANLISIFSLSTVSLGSVIMYAFFTDQADQTTMLLTSLICLVVISLFLIFDSIWEMVFLKKLLHEQQPENIFSDDEWKVIRENAMRNIMTFEEEQLKLSALKAVPSTKE